MKQVMMIWTCILIMTWVAGGSVRFSHGNDISYDGRSLIINGHRKILFSGSIHYPRSTPQMWPSLIAKAKEGGVDVIDTYVFWNLHEPKQGQYDFSGRRDIIGFIREVYAQGLYVCLRIGPFIEAEWTYGGLPFWLHDVPSIIFRSNNEPFKQHMEKWVTKIVNIMKEERLFASQGGPIILSQIENEYHRIEAAFGKAGPSYISWAAAMAVGLKTGVPWIMCNQQDAPNPVINTCNGMECGMNFSGPNSPNKPSIWTENWTSFLQRYGEESFKRTAENIAFHVALFIAKRNGTFVNYYMYHGGTNFGRTAAAYIVTSYYDEAPLDEYGLIREPKWSHLKELHAAIKLCSDPLLYGVYEHLSLGQLQDAFAFRRKSGECAAFLANNDNSTSTRVSFQNSSYELPPMSISILPDCRNIAFNTAKISTRYNRRAYNTSYKFKSVGAWELYREPLPIFAKTKLRAKSLLDHMSTTKDTTDYLWYSFSFQHHSSIDKSVLYVQSKAHILHAFVNGDYVGSARGGGRRSYSMNNTVQLIKGTNNIALLSVMVGFPDSGPYLEHRVSGIRKVKVKDTDFRRYSWGYQVGLVGEQLQVFSEKGTRRVQWSKVEGGTPGRLVWYKTIFDAPEGDKPLALQLGSMGKGEAWVNGESIGRYWVSLHTPKGKPSQTWYHVPRSFLKPRNNLLVLLEEESGNPFQISLDHISL